MRQPFRPGTLEKCVPKIHKEKKLFIKVTGYPAASPYYYVKSIK